MNQSYRARNDAARTDLASLLKQLRPDDLERPLGNGWTVKAALAHLAFWDRYTAVLVEEWQQAGFARSGEAEQGEHINSVAAGDWLSVSAEYVMGEVLRAAEVADGSANNIDDTLRAAIVEGGEGWVCDRNVHRAEHVGQIRRVLQLLPLEPL
jgi:hypothetical protein